MEDSAKAIERAPEACDRFAPFPLGAQPELEARRQEARMILASLLARHILTQIRVKNETRKVA